jgi:hypothetical protein
MAGHRSAIVSSLAKLSSECVHSIRSPSSRWRYSWSSHAIAASGLPAFRAASIH